MYSNHCYVINQVLLRDSEKKIIGRTYWKPSKQNIDTVENVKGIRKYHLSDEKFKIIRENPIICTTEKFTKECFEKFKFTQLMDILFSNEKACQELCDMLNEGN